MPRDSPPSSPEGTVWFGGHPHSATLCLRFCDDDLDPDEVTRLMAHAPTRSQRGPAGARLAPKIALGSYALFPAGHDTKCRGPDDRRASPGSPSIEGYAGWEIRSIMRGTSGIPLGFNRLILGFTGRGLLSNLHGPGWIKGAHRSLTPASPAACRSANP
jgi:hypothetical protein